MKAIAIQNFRFGQDVRRLEETTQPGVLVTLTNAHINQGGEIEKRKAFEKITLPAGTFGGQVTGTGIAVFGSGDLSGETFPEPFYYVRCRPTDAEGTVTNATMVSCIASTCFNGLPIAICDFGADGVFTFNNGSVIDDLSPGRLAAIYTDATSVADYFAGLINASGDGFTASATTGTLTVEGPTGQSFSLEAGNDSTCTSAVPAVSLTGQTFVGLTVDAVVIADSDPGPSVYWGITVYYVEGVDEWFIGLIPCAYGTTHDETTITSVEFLAAVGKVTNLTGSIEFRCLGEGMASSIGYPGSEITADVSVEFSGATVPYSIHWVANPDPFTTTESLSVSSYTPPDPTITTSVISDGTQPVSGTVPQTQFTVIAVKDTTSGGTGIVTSITVGGTEILNSGGFGLARSGTNYDTPPLLAAALKAQINTYCTAQNLSFTATVSNNIVVVRATNPAGYAALSGATVVVTVDDDVCIGNGAVRFSRSSGVTDPTWTSIKVDGAEQLGSVVPAGAWVDMTTAVAEVATTFNAYSTLYTAVASGSILYISKLATSSDDAALQISITGTDLNYEFVNPGGGNTGVSGGSFPGTIDLNKTDLPLRKYSTLHTAYLESALVTAIVGGGLPPYTYHWEIVAGGDLVYTREMYNENRVNVISSSVAPGTKIKIDDIYVVYNSGRSTLYPSGYQATIRCKVTDSLNRIGYSSNVNVHYP